MTGPNARFFLSSGAQGRARGTGDTLATGESSSGRPPKAPIERLTPRPLPTREDSPQLWEGISPGGALAIAIGLTTCVAVGDYVTGWEVNFTFLYLGPIGLATWFVGFRTGGLLSVASAVLSVAADLVARPSPLPAGVMLWNTAVQLGTFMALVLLLAALQARLAAEQHLARTDPLTAVNNRRAFEEAAAVELERARRTGMPLTVAYLDVDDFKRVNDQQGHSRGDALLATAAATLRGATRAVDVVGRLGGDEFGLLLVDTDGPAAGALLSRIRSTLDAAMAENGWSVTFSLGAATYLSPARSVDEMMGRADQLMYEAKRAGKNALRVDVLPAGGTPGAAGGA
ncbi:MAG: GGDEF domain-containing protein [Deltaproteobacteria bacterium]|nr:GGDEF domain-containing protein [Deltaproteobacteria bacterium]